MVYVRKSVNKNSMAYLKIIGYINSIVESEKLQNNLL